MTHFQRAKIIFLRSLRGRCPRCGKGHISEKLFRYRAVCDICEFKFVSDPIDLGMFLYISTAAITGIFVIGYLIIGFPTTGWYRLWVVLLGLALMIVTAPIRRYLGIGLLYLHHLVFEENDEKTRLI